MKGGHSCANLNKGVVGGERNMGFEKQQAC